MKKVLKKVIKFLLILAAVFIIVQVVAVAAENFRGYAAPANKWVNGGLLFTVLYVYVPVFADAYKVRKEELKGSAKNKR